MYDYIIVGSGIAGLFTALLASEHGSVLVLTKNRLEESNTRYAQGGIAAAMSPEDSPQLHFEDTLAAGAGLCDEAAVRVLTDEAPARIRDLLQVGVPFDKHADSLALGLEGAHQMRRILHAGGDATGWHIEQALCDAIRKAGVRVVEHCLVTELLMEADRVVGVLAQTGDGPVMQYHGQHIILASGGAGQLFRYTTNPTVATGDGLALAYRAGAEVADMEFYQFHPTALHMPGVPTFLVSEAVRGEGAYLRTIAGDRFMPRYDERAELAPRDIVSRAIVQEMQQNDDPHVLLDLRHLDPAAVYQHFPTIARYCQQYGLDMASDPLPVAPAAHYFMGGVRTNLWGETTVPGLYACGEVANTGVHGANRLASNSLLEGIVFGARIVARTQTQGIGDRGWGLGIIEHESEWLPDLYLNPQLDFGEHEALVPPTTQDLQQLMWEHVGLVRTEQGLAQAQATLEQWHAALPVPQTLAEHELANQVLVGLLMATAARQRFESRGAHYRSDAPSIDPGWRRRIVMSKPIIMQPAKLPLSELVGVYGTP